MANLQTLLQGITNWASKPAPTADGTQTPNATRMGRYNEQAIQSYINGTQALSDEGSYFVCTSPTPGTAIAMTTTITSFATTDTQATMIIQNRDINTNPFAKNMYPDYIKLMLVGLPGSATTWQFALTMDSNSSVYTSGGTILAGTASGQTQGLGAYSPNMNSGAQSVAFVAFGALSTAAKSSVSRLVAIGNLRPRVATTPVADLGDEYILKFGPMEHPGANFALGLSGGTPLNIVKNVISVPPVVLGPQQSIKMGIWGVATTGASGPTFEVEFGWFER